MALKLGKIVERVLNITVKGALAIGILLGVLEFIGGLAGFSVLGVFGTASDIESVLKLSVILSISFATLMEIYNGVK